MNKGRDFIGVVDVIACPTCGQAEHLVIGSSLWGYCKTHKVKWIAGWDAAAIASGKPVPVSAENEEHERHRYDEIGLGEFEYLGPDVEGYKQARNAR